MSRANAALERRENKVASRTNRRIARLIASLIMIPVTYLIHFTVHAIKVHGPRLIEQMKKRQ